MTVLGWTKTRTFRQPAHLRDSHAQRRRSATLMCPRAAPLVNGELVAQGEDLELEGGPRSEGSEEGGEESDEDGLHGEA